MKKSTCLVTYDVGEYHLTFFYLAHRMSEYMFIESVVVSKKLTTYVQ